MPINLLAIESSCDDTAAAILVDGHVKVNLVAGQQVHEEYGGVVPELASREHQRNIVPLVDTALKRAGLSKNDLSAVAFTKGPGLLGSLLVGCSYAKGLALGLDIPLIGVHHMRAHILAHFIDDPHPQFPFLCLTVSGGHTQIVQVNSFNEMTVLGETIDDAAGEAFDKTAKMMGLKYPGGPLVDKYAQLGNPDRFDFAKPSVPDLQFSFSGLKTSVLYFLNREKQRQPDFIDQNLNDLCASIQRTIVEILIEGIQKAVRQTGIKQVAIAGGVSANSGLRKAMEETAEQEGWTTYIPAFEYCTDNAAMIGIAGHYMYLDGVFEDQQVYPEARLPF